MKCFVCKNEEWSLIHRGTRDIENIDVIKCSSCGLVQLNSFDHVKNINYQNGGMYEKKKNIQDRLTECQNDDERRYSMVKSFGKGKKVLDFGCNTAGFLIKCKEFTQSVYGIEIEEGLEEFYKSNDLKVFKSIEDLPDEKFDLITLFHVLEHLEDPVYYIKSLLSKLDENGTLIIEVPNADDALLTIYNNESFKKHSYWSKHLYLFNQSSLGFLLNSLNLDFIIKQTQRYPLSNHLHWLSKNLPNGQGHFHFLNEEKLNKEYENVLRSIGSCDTLVAFIKKR